MRLGIEQMHFHLTGPLPLRDEIRGRISDQPYTSAEIMNRVSHS
jgi:hypothetical protein